MCLNTEGILIQKSDRDIFFCDGQVVIHLGIAPGAKGITLEQTGKNHCYKDRDVSGLCPDHHFCIEGGPERTGLHHRHEVP